MKRHSIIILSAWAVLIMVPSLAVASGTTAADFLNINVSARQAAWGGAGLALDNSIAASYFNPAGLSMIDRPGINVMHNLWYQDISYEFLGAAMPIGSNSTFGIAAAYLHMGKIDIYDMLDQQSGTLSPYSMAGIISYGRRISESFGIGIGAKYITEKLADVQANGYAVDLGAQYYTGGFTFGLAATNLGPKMKYEFESFSIPSAISIGGSYELSSFPLSFLMGVKAPISGEVGFSTGFEYKPAEFLALRSGYGGIGADNAANNLNFGAGFKFMGGTIDYAFNPGGDLGSTHFFSFTYNFGEARRPEFPEKTVAQQISNAPTIVSSPPQQIALAEPVPETIATPVIAAKPKIAKPVYIVSAGKFSDPSSALTQIEMLRKLNVEGKAEQLESGEYQVVLLKTDKLKKAEKLHNEIRTKGLASSIEIQ
jgi:hypothetical protein